MAFFAGINEALQNKAAKKKASPPTKGGFQVYKSWQQVFDTFSLAISH